MSVECETPCAPSLPIMPRIETSALFARNREVILVHKDQEYRLRLTSNDKLILTK